MDEEGETVARLCARGHQVGKLEASTFKHRNRTAVQVHRCGPCDAADLSAGAQASIVKFDFLRHHHGTVAGQLAFDIDLHANHQVGGRAVFKACAV